MSRETWRLIKESKFFYVMTYRRVLTTLVFSTILNLCLGIALYFVYFNQPAPEYYATSGVVPPILLTAMDSPNNTSVPLLPDEELTDDTTRAIPG